MKHTLLLSPFYRWRNWGISKSSTLSKVTQLLHRGSEILKTFLWDEWYRYLLWQVRNRHWERSSQLTKVTQQLSGRAATWNSEVYSLLCPLQGFFQLWHVNLLSLWWKIDSSGALLIPKAKVLLFTNCSSFPTCLVPRCQTLSSISLNFSKNIQSVVLDCKHAHKYFLPVAGRELYSPSPFI